MEIKFISPKRLYVGMGYLVDQLFFSELDKGKAM
jgi:hypothetical protein